MLICTTEKTGLGIATDIIISWKAMVQMLWIAEDKSRLMKTDELNGAGKYKDVGTSLKIRNKWMC